MVRLLNVSYQEFRENAKNKNIYLWGAGKIAPYYIKNFCKDIDIMALVDRNNDLSGKNLNINGNAYPIISERLFLEYLKNSEESKQNIVIFITPFAYIGEIIKHLNEIELLDEIECYSGALLRDFYNKCQFEFTQGEEQIPKKIHYCWFGGKDIPNHLKCYMETWHKFCPDYEIIRWDETNYDISKNRYMREAYECKRWGFVPDYARLDIVYNEGGIYLDTDVELLSSLDRLLCDEMFCGFCGNFEIALGIGFGAVKGHKFIKKMRDYYDNFSFYLQNGQLNLKTCYEYQNPVFENCGFQLENMYQKRNGIVLYPSEVLSPDMGLISKNYTENTVAVHHFEYSWGSEEERKAYELQKKELKDLVER